MEYGVVGGGISRKRKNWIWNKGQVKSQKNLIEIWSFFEFFCAGKAGETSEDREALYLPRIFVANGWTNLSCRGEWRDIVLILALVENIIYKDFTTLVALNFEKKGYSRFFFFSQFEGEARKKAQI